MAAQQHGVAAAEQTLADELQELVAEGLLSPEDAEHQLYLVEQGDLTRDEAIGAALALRRPRSKRDVADRLFHQLVAWLARNDLAFDEEPVRFWLDAQAAGPPGYPSLAPCPEEQAILRSLTVEDFRAAQARQTLVAIGSFLSWREQRDLSHRGGWHGWSPYTRPQRQPQPRTSRHARAPRTRNVRTGVTRRGPPSSSSEEDPEPSSSTWLDLAVASARMAAHEARREARWRRGVPA